MEWVYSRRMADGDFSLEAWNCLRSKMRTIFWFSARVNSFGVSAFTEFLSQHFILNCKNNGWSGSPTISSFFLVFFCISLFGIHLSCWYMSLMGIFWTVRLLISLALFWIQIWKNEWEGCFLKYFILLKIPCPLTKWSEIDAAGFLYIFDSWLVFLSRRRWEKYWSPRAKSRIGWSQQCGWHFLLKPYPDNDLTSSGRSGHLRIYDSGEQYCHDIPRKSSQEQVDFLVGGDWIYQHACMCGSSLSAHSHNAGCPFSTNGTHSSKAR